MKDAVYVLIMIIGWVAAIAAGLYFGLWWALVGGIVVIVNEIKGDVNALNIALGVVRILLCTLIGWLAFAFVGLTTNLAGMLVEHFWPKSKSVRPTKLR